ncbi:hypothetical protein SAMN06265795_12922 [Noviherbaspirillum humi]|uniref:Uncharacterized protein n=1 Tax=Noviherbaspirillum humi TaxID=1688639 RepID=A0A239M0I7_9BURK|nr:hypothetical protein SAMN06265795_12922 [Noviherbaspirillum humi]
MRADRSARPCHRRPPSLSFIPSRKVSPAPKRQPRFGLQCHGPSLSARRERTLVQDHPAARSHGRRTACRVAGRILDRPARRCFADAHGEGIGTAGGAGSVFERYTAASGSRAGADANAADRGDRPAAGSSDGTDDAPGIRHNAGGCGTRCLEGEDRSRRECSRSGAEAVNADTSCEAGTGTRFGSNRDRKGGRDGGAGSPSCRRACGKACCRGKALACREAAGQG